MSVDIPQMCQSNHKQLLQLKVVYIAKMSYVVVFVKYVVVTNILYIIMCVGFPGEISQCQCRIEVKGTCIIQ